MTLSDWHQIGAWVVMGANTAVGVWALAAHRFRGLRHVAGWWATAVAQLLIVAQAAMGVAIVDQQDRDLPGFHAFYGFVSIAAVGIVYSYRSQLKGKVYLLYGGSGLFLAGMALRAIFLPPT